MAPWWRLEVSNIGWYAVGLIGAFLVVVLLALFCWVLFALAALFTGNSHYEYRCAPYGVVESRKVFWGASLLPYSPIDGDPAGACEVTR